MTVTTYVIYRTSRTLFLRLPYTLSISPTLNLSRPSSTDTLTEPLAKWITVPRYSDRMELRQAARLCAEEARVKGLRR